MTVRSLRWEGVAFETFYRRIVEPALAPGADVTHFVFGGLDGYSAVVSIEDALRDDVLIAEGLDGRPLSSDHGAPARLLSPSQYGFVSCKHLCRVEARTGEPSWNFGHASRISRIGFGLPAFRRHPRARVWQEERHAYLPAWSLRTPYRLITPPIRWLSSRGSDSREDR